MEDPSRRKVLQSGLVACVSGLLPHVHRSEIKFKKHVIDSRFVAEGVTVADVNRDGKLDILAGNVWYEAPHWTPHEIAPFQKVDPATAYSNCFNTWAVDLDRDGWMDQLVIGMPGEKAFWRENPKGKNEPWKVHPVWRSACNESPHFVDLFGRGHRVLVMGYDEKYMAWLEPSADPYAEWQCHNISEINGPGSQRYSHGLGVGDMNNDGYSDVITREGYYVNPGKGSQTPWKFIKEEFGPECAQMLPYDVNHDARMDLISSSAHARGVWWYEHLKDGGYKQHLIDDSISETHSLVAAHFGGRMNVVTGKRFWAHPPGTDVGSDEPALLVRYELDGKNWVRHVIDEDSGVGTQFVVADMTKNGLLDIVIANKKGVFLFEQLH